MGSSDLSLSHALDRLYHRNLHVIKLGLETMQALLDALDHPEKEFAAIHVAGTNGKGSVCAMVESVLRAAGLRTGLYTSPHLVTFNERIRVGGRKIADDELIDLIPVIEEAEARAMRNLHRAATFFEFTTSLAFEYFRRRKVQVAVLETGLGGRLDATNVVHPMISVITNIGLDHVEHLGTTVKQVAAEKAGILKPGVPAVTGRLVPEAEEMIREVANRQGVAVRPASDIVRIRRLECSLDGQKLKAELPSGDLRPFRLPLLGSHQTENCAVAIAALENLKPLLPPVRDDETIASGLENVDWPARFQVLERDPPLVVDAAHNPGGADVLRKTLSDVMQKRPVGLIVSFSKDKDAVGFLRVIAPIVKQCWAVQMKVERGISGGELSHSLRAAGIEHVQAGLVEAVRDARAWAEKENGVVCVAGSIYLAGELLEVLKRTDVVE